MRTNIPGSTEPSNDNSNLSNNRPNPIDPTRREDPNKNDPTREPNPDHTEPAPRKNDPTRINPDWNDPERVDPTENSTNSSKSGGSEQKGSGNSNYTGSDSVKDESGKNNYTGTSAGFMAEGDEETEDEKNNSK